MGAGGRMSTKEEGQPERAEQRQHPGVRNDDTYQRVPVEKPPFSVGDLKKAIPPHCFRRSLLRSFSYVLVDLLFVSMFLHLALRYIPLLPYPFHLAAWPLYWAAQGCVMTGVWVLAHECGHHAFSDYALLDDLVGFVLHSALLVPYFSWKYSHRRHHSNTGSIERDEVFVPKAKSQTHWYSIYLNNPAGRLFVIAVQLTLGWPLYLVCNASGRHYDCFASHFDPYGPIYNDRERAQIFASDAGFLAVCYALYRLSLAFSFWWVVRVYGVPLLITNGFLVLITYLQHTHPALPHYESSEWDWLRGALATVDRDFGFLNSVFHHIADTHVAHHLFSTMPHYHAMEATRAIKAVIGNYYKYDGTSIPAALYREVKECLYVEPDADGKGVLWYRNKY